MGKRDDCIDFIKAFAMLCVVFWHTMQYSEPRMPQWISNFIVEMNMPLFFALSGYFASRAILIGDFHKVVTHIRLYLQPFVVMCVAFACLYAMLQYLISGMQQLVWLQILQIPLKRFLFCGWYLWVLSFSYIVACVCVVLANRMSASTIAVLLLSIPLVYFIPHLPQGVFHVNYLALVYPFFVCGMLMFDRMYRVGNGVGLACLIVYLVVVFCGGSWESNGLGLYTVVMPGLQFVCTPRAILLTCCRWIVGISGIVGIVWLLRKIWDIVPQLHAIATLGETTLGVYILHEWIIKRLVDCSILPAPRFKILIIAIMLLIVCHCVVKISWRSLIINRWLWGRCK